jgi:hypothetical protein
MLLALFERGLIMLSFLTMMLEVYDVQLIEPLSSII